MSHTLTVNAPNGVAVTLDIRGNSADVGDITDDLDARWDATDLAGATSSAMRSQALVAQCRFALLRASVGSIVATFPPVLLSTLVRAGCWSVDRALGVGRAAPTPLGRARALVHLLPVCPTADQPALIAEFLQAVATFANDERPDSVCSELVSLAMACPAPYRTTVLRHGLRVARSLANDYMGVSSIEVLAPMLSPPLLRAALGLVQQFIDPFHQQLVVTALAPHLPETLHGYAIHVATQIPDAGDRATALMRLLPLMAPKRQGQVIDLIAGALARDPEPGDCVRSLVHCAMAVAQPGRTRLLHLALKALPHMAQGGGLPLPTITNVSAFTATLHPERRSTSGDLMTAFETLAEQQVIQYQPILTIEHIYALIELAAAMPPEQRHRYAHDALQAISQSVSGYWQARCIEYLIPSCPNDLLPQVTDRIQAIATMDDRASALLTLAAHTPVDLQGTFLLDARTAIDHVQSPSQRVALLCRLVTTFPELADATVRAQALAAARTYPGHDISTDYLMLLAPLFPEQETQLLLESLDATRQVDEDYRVPPVLTLLARLPDHALAHGLQAAAGFRYRSSRTKILDALAPRLPHTLLDEAVRIAMAVDDGDEQAFVVASLAEELAHTGDYGTALELLAPLMDTFAGSMAFAHIAPQLPPPLLAQALDLAQAIPEPSLRTTALISLLPVLSEVDRHPIIAAGIAEVHRLVEDENTSAVRMLDQLAPYLDHDNLMACLPRIQRLLVDEPYYQWQIENILQQLVVYGHQEAAVALTHQSGTMAAYLQVAPLLDAEDTSAMLAEAYRRVREQITDSAYAAYDLAILGVAEAPVQRTEVLAEALAAARTPKLDLRTSVLAEVATHVPVADRASFVEEALSTLRTATDPSRALARLAPMLTTAQANQALAIIDQIPADQRTEAFIALLPVLPAAQQQALLAQIVPAILESDVAYPDLGVDIGVPLAQLAPEALYRLWTTLVRHAARHDRPHLLRDLDKLVPVIAALGGQTALAGVAHVVLTINDLFEPML